MLGVILDADSLGHDVDLSPITNLLDEWQVYPTTQANEVAARIQDASVVLSNKIFLSKESVARAKNLTFVSVTATGTNNIDFGAMSEHQIQVSNAIGYGTPSVVQHTLTLILTLSTNIHRYLNDVRHGQWQSSNVFCLLDHPIQEIAGKQLGIVGYGELGKAVGSAAESLGMEIAISERPGKTPRDGRQSFEQVLRESDYVSLHCPLNDQSQHMINQSTLKLMKDSAFLINTARGGLIDSPSLVQALSAGNIAGAAVDVLDTEPPTKDELLINQTTNLLVTPHNAWGAIESRRRLIEQTKENIEAYLAGTPIRLVCD
jgi:glycerate dehydrogenase